MIGWFRKVRVLFRPTHVLFVVSVISLLVSLAFIYLVLTRASAVPVVNEGLRLSVSASSESASPGELVEYTVTYSNAGEQPVTSVYAVGYYDRVHYVSAEPAPMPPSTNIWAIGRLDPGTTGTLRITVQIDPSLPEGSILANLVQIDAAETSAIGEICTTRVTKRSDCHYLEEIGAEDGNDEWTEAKSIDFERTYCAYPDDGNDYYHFQLDRRTTVRIEIHNYNPQNHGDLLLYGLIGTDSPQSRPHLDQLDQWGEGGDSMYILAKRLYPGDYYVRVYTEDGYYAPGVPYTLAVFRTPAVGLEVK